MKKSLFVVAIISVTFGIVGSANAQAAGLSSGPLPSGSQSGQKGQVNLQERMMEALSKLNLTVEQRAKVKDLTTKIQGSVQDIRKQVIAGTLKMDDAKKKVEALRKSARDSITAVLTPNQKRQFLRQLKEERLKAEAEAKAAKTGSTTKSGSG